MDADSLLNPERRMLRRMQEKPGHEWTLDEILEAANGRIKRSLSVPDMA